MVYFFFQGKQLSQSNFRNSHNMFASTILRSVEKGASLLSHYVPKNPDWEQAIKKEFKNQGFMKTLQANLEKISPGFCEISVPFSPKLT